MMKRIIGRYYYRTSSHPKDAKPSVIVTLECGHEKHFKGSKEPRTDAAKCDVCEGRPRDLKG